MPGRKGPTRAPAARRDRLDGHSRGSRLLRLWRGDLTVGEAAKNLALDYARYAQWENGNARPGLWWANEIKRATGGLITTESWFETDPGEFSAEARAS